MKIIGFENIDGRVEMVLKGDSALLNNRKPMFVPDWTTDLRMNPCRVLRVSRLGKHIDSRFAGRYYDAVAPAIDFVAYDILEDSRRQQGSWTRASAFDYSLSVGMFDAPETAYTWQIEKTDGTMSELDVSSWCIGAEEAIHRVSGVMTIRQGDLIYIGSREGYRVISPNEIVHAYTCLSEERLYCKIK